MNRKAKKEARTSPVGAGQAALDEHVPELLLNSLWSIQAGIASAATGRPYTEMRQIFTLKNEERSRLSTAALGIVEQHADFFRDNRDLIELVASLMGSTAAAMDRTEEIMAEASAKENQQTRVYTPKESFWLGTIILAPFILVLVVVVVKHLKERG